VLTQLIMPRIISKSYNSMASDLLLFHTLFLVEVPITNPPFHFGDYSPSTKKWVAPSSKNISTLKLFIGSVPATTSDATLTSSCVRWKTLPGVRSFCAPGLPRLEFAPDWEDLTSLFTVTDCW
jgi:hypothetical protein